jgi:hypothetical protein
MRRTGDQHQNLFARARLRVRRSIKRNEIARTGLFLVQNVFSLTQPEELAGRQQFRPTTPRFNCVMFSRCLNEKRFIREWIAHHLILGIDHFYIYDNGSSDGTLDELAPLVEAGILTLISWPQRPASPSCDRHFFQTFGHDAAWVARFDIDEFLVLEDGLSLRELLRINARYPAIAIPCRRFGSSYHRTIPNGLVREHFVRAEAHLDGHVKVIANPKEARRYRNPHNLYYRRARLARTADGMRAYGSFARVSARSPAVINHYVFRSSEDFASKATRGSGDRHHWRAPELAEMLFTQFNDCYVPPTDSNFASLRALLDSWPPAAIAPSETNDEVER